MNIVWPTVLAIVLIELATLYCRKHIGTAKEFWQNIGFYHIHHSYFGLLLLVVYAVYGHYALLVIGSALILSDLFHHSVMLRYYLK